MEDTISRQAVLDKFEPWLNVKDYNDGELNMLKAVLYEIRFMRPAQPDVPDINVGDINKFIDSLEEIFADLRERHGDDSVCGLCEYDGAYIGQSGDWCNECPGFDRDDCFKLSDKCRKRWIDTITKALPSAQPEIIRCKDCKYWVPGYITDNDDFIPPKCREWQQMVGHSSDDYCSLAERREVTT